MHLYVDDDTSEITAGFSSYLNDPSTFESTPLNDEVAQARYFTSKIKYKSEGIRATKDLFLVSPDTHPDIPPDLYLNGIILSVPWGGCQ